MVYTIYGLWFHITKQHPNQSTSQCTVRCPVCHTVFKGLQKLDSHVRGSHLERYPPHEQFSSDEDEKGASPVAKKSSVTASKSVSSLSVISQETLLQMDFSCSKFALVAQISAEHVPFRRMPKASATCRSCDQSFPCVAALNLHSMNVHDEAVHAMSCTACSLSFGSHAQRDDHMMQIHDAPQVLVEFIKSSEDSDPRAGKVTREEFLLVLGLKALPVIDDAVEDTVPPLKQVAKVSDVDANQNLLKTVDTPVTVSASPNTAGPSVVAPLMALAAPVTPVFSNTLTVSNVLPHNLSPASSQAVPPSGFQLISNFNAMAFMNANPNSLQSITAMTGSFPFLSPPFVAPASLERQSPGVASNVVKNFPCGTNLSSPAGNVVAESGTKSSGGSDAEDCSKTGVYY